jgi:hypothetical protein
MSDFNSQNDLNEVNATTSAPTPVVPNKKGFDIASLVLGITAIVPGCCCTYLGIILGILAIVFSVLFTKANPGNDVKKGLAKAGLILGIIGVILCVALMIFGFIFASSNWYEEIMNQYTPY